MSATALALACEYVKDGYSPAEAADKLRLPEADVRRALAAGPPEPPGLGRVGSIPDPVPLTAESEAPATEDPPRTAFRDRLLTLQGLASLPPVRPLVDGLLYRNTLAQLSGPPGNYKSFIAIGIAASVALGQSWEGHAVPSPGRVIYVVAEGATGLRARLLAWCELSGVDPAELEGKLLFHPAPIQLGNALDVSEVEMAAKEMDAALVVLDTRARCTLGLDENSATEQGKAIHAAERIQRGSGATVLPVHHSGRSGSHGRGSNAWDGAIWSDLQVTGQDLRAQIHCEKHKDVPDGCDHYYRLVPHTVSEKLMPGCTEKERSTLVIVQMGPLDFRADDRRSTQAILDIVRTSGGIEGLTRPQMVELAEEQNVSRSSVYAAVNALVERAVLRNIGSEKRPRYVVRGAQLGAVEGTDGH
jgi:hypothetical protein